MSQVNADTLETSCRCGVEEFQGEIKVAQKTALTPQVQREAQQMTQMMTRSKVQNIPKPDLEQTAARSPDAMMQVSSRQPRSRQVRCCRISTDSTRPRQSPPTARYKARSAKTDPHSAERLCTATSKEETSFSRKASSHKSKAWEWPPACNASQ